MQDPTYTAHAATAGTAAVSAVAVASWAVKQFAHVDVPTELMAPSVILATPIASYILKKLGWLSS